MLNLLENVTTGKAFKNVTPEKEPQKSTNITAGKAFQKYHPRQNFLQTSLQGKPFKKKIITGKTYEYHYMEILPIMSPQAKPSTNITAGKALKKRSLNAKLSTNSTFRESLPNMSPDKTFYKYHCWESLKKQQQKTTKTKRKKSHSISAKPSANITTGKAFQKCHPRQNFLQISLQEKTSKCHPRQNLQISLLGKPSKNVTPSKNLPQISLQGKP